MKLQSKKARVPIAALGVTALVCGVGALASPAFAVGETLTFLGTDGNAASIVAVEPVDANTSAVTYGLKVGGSANTGALDLQVVTAPTSGAVKVIRSAVNAAPAVGALTAVNGTVNANTTTSSATLTFAAAPAWAIGDTVYNAGNAVIGTVSAVGATTVTLAANAAIAVTSADVLHVDQYATVTPVVAGAVATTVPSYAPGDNVYLGASVAGTYTLRLFKDTNGDHVYQSNSDDTTPTFTLTVKSASDAFTLTAPATVDTGATGPKATVSSSVSTTDIRGGSPATLATGQAVLMGLAITDTGSGGGGVIGEGVGTAAVYDETNGFYRYLSTGSGTALTQDAGTPKTVSTAFTFNGTAVGSAKTTEVVTNGVDTLTLAPKAGQETNVSGTGVGVKVRTGIGKVTYSSLASAGATAQAGKTISYTLTPGSGITLADLSVNGVAVPTTGVSAGKVTATTDSAGMASIEVTSAKTADGNIYSIAASSGTGSATTTSTYTAAAVTSVMITSTTAELTPEVTATTVPVMGRLVDQYGEKFQPPSSDTQQVVVSGAATGNAVVTDGMFTYNYVPTTTPVAGTTTSLTFTYNGGANVAATIQWASTVAAAKVTLTAPMDGATAVTLQDNTTPVPAQGNTGTPAFGNTTGAVAGTVYDASNAALAFKSVTLTGSEGVWFANSATPDATHKLVKTLDVVTSNTGAISGAWVFFTKSGTAKVMAATAAISAESTVTTDEPAAGQKYRISVNDVVASPGQTVIITGMVEDIFENAVPGATVDLSTGASTVGALGNTSVNTNSAGVFSTTFLAGSNQSGVVDLTATLNGMTTNPTPNADYATAGITLTDGTYQDIGKITVSDVKLTLVATEKITAGYKGGMTTLSGTAMPSSSVLIYAKASGERSYSLIDSVEVDADGEWTVMETIMKSTYFFARSGDGMSSQSDSTLVYSQISRITAKALGHKWVKIYANGDPNGKGKLTFYRSIAGPDVKLKTVTSSKYGSATVKVKLPRGTRTVYAKYKAPGTGTGMSKKIKVKVK